MAYSSLIQYFQDLANANVSINGSFIHGPTSRIIGAQRDDLTFPVLYLEHPDFDINDNGANNITNDFVVAFSILTNTDGSEANEDQALIAMDEIMQDFCARIWRDRTTYQWRMTLNNFSITPVYAKMADNLWGWRCEFRLNENVPFLLNTNKWNDLIP